MTMQITINGRLMPVESGQTILQVARENGIDIPTLCDYPGLKSHGSCRMCIVEVEGREITPSACTTLAENGMVIHTNSPKVSALRAGVVQAVIVRASFGLPFL